MRSIPGINKEAICRQDRSERMNGVDESRDVPVGYASVYAVIVVEACRRSG